MQHAKEADLGTEMPGIARDLKQGLSTGMKEQVVDDGACSAKQAGPVRAAG